MKNDESTASASPAWQSQAPDDCYDTVNDSSIDEHLASLGNNNLLRADARVKIYRTLFQVEPKSIADIGCGVGLTTAALKRAYPEAAVFGYDLSESAISYASREVSADAEFRAVSITKDTVLERKFELMIFQEFYPFTRTPDFSVHADFLTFMERNLAARGLALIQLAIRHPEGTILNNIEELEAFCANHRLELSQHLIPFDRLVDMTKSVAFSNLISPFLAELKGYDKRIVLKLSRAASS